MNLIVEQQDGTEIIYPDVVRFSFVTDLTHDHQRYLAVMYKANNRNNWAYLYEMPKSIVLSPHQPTKPTLFKIVIDIMVGEYEHDEELYYYGKYADAYEYAEKYLSTIWGEKTLLKEDGQYWCGDRAARLSSITKHDSLQVMTAEGPKTFGAGTLEQ